MTANQRAIENFDWERDFPNCSPDELVNVSPISIFNIMTNGIPSETDTVDGRDSGIAF